MAFLLTEIDIKERPSSFFGSLKLKQGVSHRVAVFALKTLVLLGLLAFDIAYLDLHSRDTSTIVRYYLTLLLLVVNTLYVYAYMVKRTLVEAYVDRTTELLKVKWLAQLMLAFYVPLLVFVANTTPNYRILRFNQDITTILLVALGILLHFYQSTFSPHQQIQIARTIDPNTSILKRESSAYLIFAVALISYVAMCWNTGP
jgi:hypothetical protein